jgi:hypothetical protein
MTPKQKALDLINIFFNNAESRNKIGLFDADLHEYNCKQCALIAANEILNAVNNEDETYLMIHSVNYWTKVIQELEKL